MTTAGDSLPALSLFCNDSNVPIDVAATLTGLLFLGMVTQARSGECGWAGERFFGYEKKLYLGDVIGRIDLLYEGNLMDGIPLIFGVNVWNYETFCHVQPHEAPVYPIRAPYREPFDSDPAARNLLEAALLLRENPDGEKYSRYIFALRTRHRRLTTLAVHPWGSRHAEIGVSAITAIADGVHLAVQEAWRFTDQQFYVRKEYFSSVDRLARRLYQYSDELPDHYPLHIPVGYQGPHIEMRGRPEAELLTNVYYHNIHDMITHKVEDDGRMHTSTRHYPCYGFYEGIGTYRQEGQYNYYDQIWSRDLGRLLCEIIEHGETERCARAADLFFHYLYDPSSEFKRPHWKRIVNASELGVFPENYEGISFQEFVKGRENDGHASVMLMIYRLYQHRCVGLEYLRAHRQELVDAAEWFCWQMDNPGLSGFSGVLCSESESSYGEHGGYDLLSNSYAWSALAAFATLAREMGEVPFEKRWASYADRLLTNVLLTFTATHPRYGTVLSEPESDNWPSELKLLASLLLMPETTGYDPAEDAPQWYPLWANSYRAQKEAFFSPMVGGSMGYGQGYTTQAALLLDQVEDYTDCLGWAARFSYHHSEYPYIVPEGVTAHPSGRFWYRHTDLGNAVQQTEIVKCVRLVFGLDDLRPGPGLRLVPRLPDGWQLLEARRSLVVALVEGEIARIHVDWLYRRVPGGFEAELTTPKPIRVASVRFGPFPDGVDRVSVKGDGVEAVAVLRKRGSRQFAYVRLDREVEAFRLRVVEEQNGTPDSSQIPRSGAVSRIAGENRAGTECR